MTIKTPDLGFEPRGLFIGGEWVDAGSGGTITSINPSNGDVLGEVPLADEADVDAAVGAAREAFPAWAALPASSRAEYLVRLADAIDEHADHLALMDAVDSGNAISGMRGDMTWTSDTYRYFAGLVTEIKGETMSREPGHLNLTLRQPYGVVAKINPFNHPFRFAAEKAASALAAGNTVVIKGPEQAPLSSLRLGELCEDIFPPGVVNIVTGDGKTGSAMVRHRHVHRIGFVGSAETGRIIAREAAEGLKEVTLELGGKNPIIIFPDADPKKAALAAVKAMNMNRQGQSCSSTSRVLVHASLHEQVRDELVKAVSAIPIGVPWAPGAEMGPIVSQQQFDRVMRYIGYGGEDGAKLLTGGGPPDDPDLKGGFFVEPAVFDGVTPQMRIGSEEIFGPVMSIMTWSSFDEMIEIANGVMYGLTASIVTNDYSAAMRTVEQVEAGYVWVNSSGRYLGAPYGGWKQSGIGREETLEELLSYTRLKNVNMRW
ncbi:MAG TPA: aldehyde dehydrogenase family protein [Rhizobiales bacterium]|nr:2-formylbenzoate dehydrogenase [bacterium BMS3Bbin10]HDO52441.1 aldehyde dehydrogenase family protein [Hyphomicrobiales bacterium]